MDAVATPLLIPSRPPPPAQDLSLVAFLRAVRTNALTLWTEAAYDAGFRGRGASWAAPTCC